MICYTLHSSTESSVIINNNNSNDNYNYDYNEMYVCMYLLPGSIVTQWQVTRASDYRLSESKMIPRVSSLTLQCSSSLNCMN